MEKFYFLYGLSIFGYHFPDQSSWTIDSVFVYGRPSSKTNLWSVVLVFPSIVWILMGVCTFCFAFLFYLAGLVYQRVPEHEKLFRRRASFLDVMLRVLATLTEPETTNLFSNRWSTGSFAEGIS